MRHGGPPPHVRGDTVPVTCGVGAYRWRRVPPPPPVPIQEELMEIPRRSLTPGTQIDTPRGTFQKKWIPPGRRTAAGGYGSVVRCQAQRKRLLNHVRTGRLAAIKRLTEPVALVHGTVVGSLNPAARPR